MMTGSGLSVQLEICFAQSSLCVFCGMIASRFPEQVILSSDSLSVNAAVGSRVKVGCTLLLPFESVERDNPTARWCVQTFEWDHVCG